VARTVHVIDTDDEGRKMNKITNPKLISLVRRFPGLDAIALKGKGFRPNLHGSLRDAERAGDLMFRNGGWYVAVTPDENTRS